MLRVNTPGPSIIRYRSRPRVGRTRLGCAPGATALRTAQAVWWGKRLGNRERAALALEANFAGRLPTRKVRVGRPYGVWLPPVPSLNGWALYFAMSSCAPPVLSRVSRALEYSFMARSRRPERS